LSHFLCEHDKDTEPDKIDIVITLCRFSFQVKIFNELIRQPGEKWGREDGGKFMLRNFGITFLASGGSHLMKTCDIRTGVKEINVARYVISKFGGCKYLYNAGQSLIGQNKCPTRIRRGGHFSLPIVAFKRSCFLFPSYSSDYALTASFWYLRYSRDCVKERENRNA